MSTEDNGGSAFPAQEQIDYPSNSVMEFHLGMTLRDYFAAKAMPACYAETCRESENSGWLENWKMGVALDAYAMADALLEARKK